MARAQAQYLKVYDSSVTYQRWQSYYVNAAVTWDSASWLYQEFDAAGIADGTTGDESGMTIALPATAMVMDVANAAIANGYLVELKIYGFDALINNATPPADQVLIASFVGKVVGASASLTTITLQLGSAVAPVGAQVPIRTLTTRIMGKGCVL